MLVTRVEKSLQVGKGGGAKLPWDGRRARWSSAGCPSTVPRRGRRESRWCRPRCRPTSPPPDAPPPPAGRPLFSRNARAPAAPAPVERRDEWVSERIEENEQTQRKGKIGETTKRTKATNGLAEGNEWTNRPRTDWQKEMGERTKATNGLTEGNEWTNRHNEGRNDRSNERNHERNDRRRKWTRVEMTDQTNERTSEIINGRN